MVRLGMRFAVAGGKEAITRLALIAIAVAIGVGLLLSTLGSVNAFEARDERYAWLETGYPGAEVSAGATSLDETVAADPLWWLLRADYFQGEEIGRVDVAATGPDSPVPPGSLRCPGPASSTPRRRWRCCCATHRSRSSMTASPERRSAPSARRRCRRRTR